MSFILYKWEVWIKLRVKFEFLMLRMRMFYQLKDSKISSLLCVVYGNRSKFLIYGFFKGNFERFIRCNSIENGIVNAVYLTLG